MRHEGRSIIIPTASGRLQTFFIHTFLYSRLDLGLETGQRPLDEEVNMYLAHLMSVSMRGFDGVVDRPLINLDCAPLLSGSFSDAEKGRLWRRLADGRMMTDGLLWSESEGNLVSRGLEPQSISGATCYLQAAAYSQQGYRRSRTVQEVLAALGAYYSVYVRILRHLASEYLNFLPRCSAGQLADSLADGEHQCSLDRFLEILSQWKRAPSAELKQKLLTAALAAGIPADKLPTDLQYDA